MSSEPPKRILLLSHARTACHLLERMLSAQPNVAYASHPFASSWPLVLNTLNEGPLDMATQQSKNELMKSWQAAFTTSLEPFIQRAAEEGKVAFVHFHPHFSLQPALASAYIHGSGDAGEFEAWVVKSSSNESTHSQDNPEVLPDETLLAPGTIPILTIRHPALMVPSIYRANRKVNNDKPVSRETGLYTGTLRWQRLLYDFYVKHGPAHGIKPLIVDADDYQGKGREAFMARLCDAVGLDSKSVQYSWPKATDDDLKAMPPHVAMIKKTILGSDRIIEGLDSTSLDLDVEEAKWSAEFGGQGATEVKDLIKRTMVEYEYLSSRKFT